MQNIPDHWHAHARPEGGFFGHGRRRQASRLTPPEGTRRGYFSAVRMAAGPPFILTRWPVSRSVEPSHWKIQ